MDAEPEGQTINSNCTMATTGLPGQHGVGGMEEIPR
jgi:hypothetical protein